MQLQPLHPSNEGVFLEAVSTQVQIQVHNQVHEHMKKIKEKLKAEKSARDKVDAKNDHDMKVMQEYLSMFCQLQQQQQQLRQQQFPAPLLSLELVRTMHTADELCKALQDDPENPVTKTILFLFK